MTLPTDRRIREIGRRSARALVESAGAGSGRTLLAAVSGGADSSAMLLLLADTQSRHGWRVRAAHVDHGIQPNDVRARFRDAASRVAALANTPIHQLEADAPAAAAETPDGLEAAARQVRYEALAQLAEDLGAAWIATAHTQDDQAETVLLHLLRGSGLDGLSGMPAARPLEGGVGLVRPLLGVSRAEIEAVCRAYGREPVHDPSNDDLAHTRNRVRQSLLPLMAELNPNIAERLAQLARSVGADRELLDLIGEQTLAQLRSSDSVPRRELLALPGQLQARVVRALCRERGVIISAERTAATLQVIHNGHGVVELPDGLRLTVAGGSVALGERCPPHSEGG